MLRNRNILFEGKTVALVLLPGASNPTCTTSQLPTWIFAVDDLKTKGKINTVVVCAVNDQWVTRTWVTVCDPEYKLTYIADCGGSFTGALGMPVAMPGLGNHTKRAATIVENGTVLRIHDSDMPGECAMSCPNIVFLEGLDKNLSTGTSEKIGPQRLKNIYPDFPRSLCGVI